MTPDDIIDFQTIPMLTPKPPRPPLEMDIISFKTLPGGRVQATRGGVKGFGLTESDAMDDLSDKIDQIWRVSRTG